MARPSAGRLSTAAENIVDITERNFDPDTLLHSTLRRATMSASGPGSEAVLLSHNRNSHVDLSKPKEAPAIPGTSRKGVPARDANIIDCASVIAPSLLLSIDSISLILLSFIRPHEAGRIHFSGRASPEGQHKKQKECLRRKIDVADATQSLRGKSANGS